jgi:hypothetical protein
MLLNGYKIILVYFNFIIANRSAKTVDSASDYSDDEIPFDNTRL